MEQKSFITKAKNLANMKNLTKVTTLNVSKILLPFFFFHNSKKIKIFIKVF